MKNEIIHYRVNDMDFIRLVFKPKKPYSARYLNKLVGFDLVESAPEYLHKYGFLRVCDSEYSWRKR